MNSPAMISSAAAAACCCCYCYCYYYYILDFAEAEMMGWQWHQMNHMQAICTSLQKITTPAPHQSDFYGPDARPTPNQ